MKMHPCPNPRCFWFEVVPTGAPRRLRCPDCGTPMRPPPPVRVVDLVREARWADA